MARRRTRAEVEAAVRHYAALLGLGDWDINVRVGYNPEDEQAMDVERRPGNRRADITFYPHQLQNDEDEHGGWFTFENCVVHELLHTFLAPLVYGYSNCAPELDETTPAAVQARFMAVRENVEEPIIAVLTRLLVRYLPKP